MASELRTVLVVGTGLIGTSIALALRERGLRVLLADHDQGAVRLARELGAGEEWHPETHAQAASASGESGESGETIDLAVLAVPPALVAGELLALQRNGTATFYTDVASVKVEPIERAAQLGCDMSTYVASHPLAGREKSGPGAARAELFLGRPWALCPTPDATPEARAAVLRLVELCGGNPVEVDAAEHDQAVAVVSHAPHVTASAVAARLADASDVALGLAGQGVRDVTRIAGSDPGLWLGILSGNATPVAEVLEAISRDLAEAATALRALADGDGTVTQEITQLLKRGVAGHGRIPGKHGGPAPAYVVVQVVVGDRPGQLARLFQICDEVGVNVEDVRLEHAPGLPLGIAEVSVQPDAAAVLTKALHERGWQVP
ncbi:prephenate dehydrogenase [Nonomuraea aurantiaca]|jgi:prephenate dehydrogenase|uniref:prephenate dehydrogenase n=1 Tax=Nonomuraea aurantiaca TaxID=2878562 RepID=UPI001CDA2992|nr:prephenate dehydrogenase [Nonomuraea aurantiaca]MCA2222570.1 prephenate dehydrogenase [Nonomuraea aurantiaca]